MTELLFVVAADHSARCFVIARALCLLLAAPLVVVRLGRGAENARRRRHSRVICVRNPADCEVKSGALLRWRSPQALAMSHLRCFGFARDRNHQKRHVRSEVSHLSCIARAPGATPSEARPA